MITRCCSRRPDWPIGETALEIEIAGEDRNRFLHDLYTAEIRKLPAGAGCEAFLTNVQGKILAHGLVFSGPDVLVLETVPGQSEKILAHLDRYLIREKVTLCDRSLDWAEWLLVGPAADQVVRTLTGRRPARRTAGQPAGAGSRRTKSGSVASTSPARPGC